MLNENSIDVDIKNNMSRRIIPSTGELLPVIGLGTSRVFDANLNEKSLNPRKKIVKALRDKINIASEVMGEELKDWI